MANANIPRIYNQKMERIAFLENAFQIQYDLKLNELWTASFSLPASDPKTAYCTPFSYVELFDGDHRVDLFRIIGIDTVKSDTSVCTYSCEHVLATLMNDVLFRYHQYGGIGINTKSVLRYILDRQETENWHLGEVDFSHQFEYKWENENLLSALFSVPKCFTEEYRWEWDTCGYPWTLSLRSASDDIKSEIRREKNMTSITKNVDATSLFNRVYPLGYGEGDNQLGIAEVNNGKNYLENGISVSNYGLTSVILTDSRFENAESLKAYAQALLRQASEPYITYEVQAIDLFRMNGDAYTKFVPGDYVQVIDKEDDLKLKTRIIEVCKSDVRSDGGNISVTLANKSQDISSSISDLQSRTRISETYAQGATNLMVQHFSDNADSDNPAVIRVFIPEEAVRINKLLLNLNFAPFRGYTKAVAGGGGQTTSSGGGSTTSSGGGTTTSSGGSTTSSATTLTGSNTVSDTSDNGGAGGANHNHAIARGTQLAITNDGKTVSGYVTWVPSGKHTHPAHSHTIGSHTHSVGSHTHSVSSHTHTVKDHVHAIEFGIYSGTTASAATIRVDGTSIPKPTNYSSIDIVGYLAKDSAGKITRNSWHEIAIYPDRLTRINASLFTQLFTNSRGSGDY